MSRMVKTTTLRSKT